MTTKEAEARYLREHLNATANAGSNIYNPRNVPVGELPVIYGFNSGDTYLGCIGRIVSQDGTYLGGHSCSHEGYMRSDLGMIPDSYHEQAFRDHYPEGFRTEFVSLRDVAGHEGLQAALLLHEQKSERGSK